MRTRKGIQGERESARYLDHYFRDGENYVLLHNLVINERGNLLPSMKTRALASQSPIEQSLRHEKVLRKLLEQLGIVGRTQKHPNFHHVVMLHPKATIERPPAKSFDTSNVIKADQFPSWHKSFVDNIGLGTLFKNALNMRSLETTREWGEKLKRQHRPANLLELPDFMRPRELSKTAGPAPSLSMNGVKARACACQSTGPCASTAWRACAVKISFAEGNFCWNNVQRFGGLAYCREHQALT